MSELLAVACCSCSALKRLMGAPEAAAQHLVLTGPGRGGPPRFSSCQLHPNKATARLMEEIKAAGAHLPPASTHLRPAERT
ncbi:hypothetical protein EYF80_046900 [Liparis tanakae]|uniref:Uncharacterized protein n=1 Tax=Liparis tanakae TaxID=230148 RepID=A0A4Z2FNT4_9TELE|nr:hypothetical protein EYF80_046900 [Liparis tanakae]